MKYLPFLFIFLSLISCKKQNDTCSIKIDKERLEKEDLYYKIIDLKEPFGAIYIEIPYQFNSYLEWVNTSDCNCCGYQSYRLANKMFNPVMESGWISSPVPDSMYQITFYHSPDNCPDIPLEAQDSIHKFLWYRGPEYIKQAASEIIFTEYQTINYLEWVVYAYYMPSYLLNKNAFYPKTYTLGAVTAIGNKFLYFKAECQAADCKTFIEKMQKAIRSIQYCPENIKIRASI